MLTDVAKGLRICKREGTLNRANHEKKRPFGLFFLVSILFRRKTLEAVSLISLVSAVAHSGEPSTSAIAAATALASAITPTGTVSAFYPIASV